MSRFLAPSLLLLAAATLAGCGTLTTPPVEMHTGAAPGGDAQAPAFTPAPAAPTAGAIYQAGGHRPLFEDRRARLAGDTERALRLARTAAENDPRRAIQHRVSRLTMVSRLILFLYGSVFSYVIGHYRNGASSWRDVTTLIQEP